MRLPDCLEYPEHCGGGDHEESAQAEYRECPGAYADLCGAAAVEGHEYRLRKGGGSGTRRESNSSGSAEERAAVPRRGIHIFPFPGGGDLREGGFLRHSGEGGDKHEYRHRDSGVASVHEVCQPVQSAALGKQDRVVTENLREGEGGFPQRPGDGQQINEGNAVHHQR